MHPAVARPTPAASRNAPAAGKDVAPDAPETMWAGEAEPGPMPTAPVPADMPVSRWSTEPPGGASAEPTVTIAATREHITYTLPVSEARLPASLLARTQPAPAASTSFDARPPAPLLPPPSRPGSATATTPVEPPASAPAAMGATERSAIPGPVATDDEFRTMALRFGPGTRES